MHFSRDEAWLAERFWQRTCKGDSCWEWTGSFNSAGYGQLAVEFIPTNKWVLAHRLSLELHNGTMAPAGLVIMHACDNRKCVNPAHLSLGTVADNNRDMAAKGRARGGGRPCRLCGQPDHNARTCSLRPTPIHARNEAA